MTRGAARPARNDVKGTTTSLETKVNFVRPVTAETGRVRCEAMVVHRGRTVATAEGRLVEERSGMLLAHGSTTRLIIPGG